MAGGGGDRVHRDRGTSYIERGFFCKIWKDEVSLQIVRQRASRGGGKERIRGDGECMGATTVKGH